MNQALTLSARNPHATQLLAVAALTALDKTVLTDTKPTAAVCVLVPPLTEIDDNTAMKLLIGSTMNGRSIDKGEARKILAQLRARAGTKYIQFGFDGEGSGHVTTTTRDGGGMLKTAHHQVQVGISAVKQRTVHPAFH